LITYSPIYDLNMIDIAAFIDNILDQFDIMPDGGLHEESILQETDGWSSITALSVMAMIDEEYNTSISASTLRKPITVKELYKTVQSGRV